jgi:hypothetical protein
MRTQPKVGRGVLYIVWGSNPKHDLRRATEAVGRIHPELPIEVVRLDQNTDGFHAKAKMFSLSPFRETVFLDADTLILSRLDFAFEKAAQFGLACCIDPSPWARKYSICEGEMIEYNTGVIFFTETARATFEAWERLTEQHRSDTKINDQATFAAAVARSNLNPFVLPPNWNFYASVMPSFLAPLKIWHCQNDPPDWLHDFEGEIYLSESYKAQAEQLINQIERNRQAIASAHIYPRTMSNLFRLLSRRSLYRPPRRAR